MQLNGDVPEDHKILAKNLEELEKSLDSLDKIENPTRAKALTCLAHDWYTIGMEDEGQRLLRKAEDACPGYFETVLVQQAQEDEDFNTVIQSLASELMFMLTNKIRTLK